MRANMHLNVFIIIITNIRYINIIKKQTDKKRFTNLSKRVIYSAIKKDRGKNSYLCNNMMRDMYT